MASFPKQPCSLAHKAVPKEKSAGAIIYRRDADNIYYLLLHYAPSEKGKKGQWGFAKGHVEKGTLRIAEADVYEAFAFSKATGCERVLLAYPALPTSVKLPVGTCSVFERVEIDTVQIVGVQVETRGISKRDALRIFSSTIAQQLPGMFA